MKRHVTLRITLHVCGPFQRLIACLQNPVQCLRGIHENKVYLHKTWLDMIPVSQTSWLWAAMGKRKDYTRKSIISDSVTHQLTPESIAIHWISKLNSIISVGVLCLCIWMCAKLSAVKGQRSNSGHICISANGRIWPNFGQTADLGQNQRGSSTPNTPSHLSENTKILNAIV